MKIILTILIGLASVPTLMAVEYVTLKNSSPNYTSDPNDVIQIMTARTSSSGTDARYLAVDGTNLRLVPVSANVASVSNSYGTVIGCEGITLHGVTNWSVNSSDPFIVVLRITKKNEGFTSEPLVIPVAQGTNYSVVMETSTDMQTWVPVNPGDYSSTGSPRFFRVKAAMTPGTP